MSGFNPYKQYQQVKVNTADQGSLILMSYDGAIRFCKAAKDCMEEDDQQGRAQWLTKAFDIVGELRKSLRPDAGGEVAGSLNEAYAFIGNQITLANVFNKTEHLDHAIMLLSSMREAWKQIISGERQRVSL